MVGAPAGFVEVLTDSLSAPARTAQGPFGPLWNDACAERSLRRDLRADGRLRVPDMDGHADLEDIVEVVRLPGRDANTAVRRGVRRDASRSVDRVVRREVPRFVEAAEVVDVPTRGVTEQREVSAWRVGIHKPTADVAVAAVLRPVG